MLLAYPLSSEKSVIFSSSFLLSFWPQFSTSFQPLKKILERIFVTYFWKIKCNFGQFKHSRIFKTSALFHLNFFKIICQYPNYPNFFSSKNNTVDIQSIIVYPCEQLIMLKKLAVIFLLFFTLPLIVTSSVFAAKDKSEQKVVVLLKNEVVNKDYFAAGQTVTLSGTVNGDAYLAGGNVIVEGVVNGDLLAAGGVVTVRGKVKNDARLAGGQIVVSSEIGGSLTTAGGTVNLTDSAKIGGSLAAGAGTLSVFAPVGKGANIGAGQVTLGSKFGSDVTMAIGQLTLTPNTQIAGDLTYWSEQAAQIQEGAQVSGKTIHNLPPQKVVEEAQPTQFLGFIAGLSLIVKIISLISIFIVGLVLLKFFPVYTQRTVNVVLKKPGASFFVGLLTLILTPIIFVILLVTVVGIPLALIFLVSILFITWLAKIFVSLALGEKILGSVGQKGRRGWALVLGLIILGILTSIPFVGWIIWLLVVFFGLGAVVLEEKGFYSQLRSKNLI